MKEEVEKKIKKEYVKKDSHHMKGVEGKIRNDLIEAQENFSEALTTYKKLIDELESYIT